MPQMNRKVNIINKCKVKEHTANETIGFACGHVQ